MNNIVQELRKQTGKSQEVCANDLGISRVTLSKIENGSIPNGVTMLRIANYFDKKVGDIFFECGVNHTVQE